VNFLEKVVGAFVQDEIRPRPNLSLVFGLRYDWMDFFHDNDNFAPRASFAFSPDERGRTVVRGGAGVFYDRPGPGPIQDLQRYDGRREPQLAVFRPGRCGSGASTSAVLTPGSVLGKIMASLLCRSPR
jgi:outer membrane receptor protein involved in Fe transport